MEVFLVIGKSLEDSYDTSCRDEWIVKGFTSLDLAQKFIDKLSIELLDSKEYINVINSPEEILQENETLLVRFYRKYGNNVFGNRDIMLGTDSFLYRVERSVIETE